MPGAKWGRRFAVDIPAIQRALLSQYGLRIDPVMGEYVLANLRSAGSGSLPVIGGDARTGVPMRTTIDLDALAAAEGAEANPGSTIA
jgi:hypothetical protein